MPSDNEIMVLIYETVQKQLNQIKDSRVVIQTLTNRVAELDITIKEISGATGSITDRLAALEDQVSALSKGSGEELESVSASNAKLKDTIDAMRGTLDRVTNPNIALISRNSRDLKDGVRDLAGVHRQVMDEFEQYEIRLVRLEDSIDKMLKKQLLDINNVKTEHTDDE